MKKVQTGDNLDIKASTWNAFIDAANFVKGVQSNQSGNSLKNGMVNGMVFIKNMENNTFPQYSALVLTDILIKPENNELEFKRKNPVFIGSKMTTNLEGKPYAILLEPLENGKIGRALLLGVTPAKVNILDPENQFATPTIDSSSGTLESSASGVARILWKGGNSGVQWCMLQLGGAGSGGGEVAVADDRVVLCKVAYGNAETGFNVSIYADGKNGGVTSTGTLFATELALNSFLPRDTWILGHKHMISVIGGND